MGAGSKASQEKTSLRPAFGDQTFPLKGRGAWLSETGFQRFKNRHRPIQRPQRRSEQRNAPQGPSQGYVWKQLFSPQAQPSLNSFPSYPPDLWSGNCRCSQGRNIQSCSETAGGKTPTVGWAESKAKCSARSHSGCLPWTAGVPARLYRGRRAARAAAQHRLPAGRRRRPVFSQTFRQSRSQVRPSRVLLPHSPEAPSHATLDASVAAERKAEVPPGPERSHFRRKPARRRAPQVTSHEPDGSLGARPRGAGAAPRASGRLLR